MEVYSVKHKPTVYAAITNCHAGVVFGDRDLADRYAVMVGSSVEVRETADIGACRRFQAEDYVENTIVLLDQWEAQLPKLEPKVIDNEPKLSPAASAAIAQRAANANKR